MYPLVPCIAPEKAVIAKLLMDISLALLSALTTFDELPLPLNTINISPVSPFTELMGKYIVITNIVG